MPDAPQSHMELAAATAYLRGAIQGTCDILERKRDELLDLETPGSVEDHLLCDTREMLAVLERLLRGKSIHEAFGAPGDWGYDHPIGRALSRLYKEDAPTAKMSLRAKLELPVTGVVHAAPR